MSKLTDYNSIEKQILIEKFNTMPLMEPRLANVIENYIYSKKVELWSNNQPKLEFNYKYDASHGTHREWLENGDLVCEKHYLDGLLHGQSIENTVRTRYNYDICVSEKYISNKHTVSNYKNGLLDGDQIYYNSDNKISKALCYRDGSLNGVQTYNNHFGNMVQQITYSNGLIDGKFIDIEHKSFHTGNWRRRRFFIPVKTETSYIADIATGPCIEYFTTYTGRITNKIVVQANYINGMLEGKYTSWYRNPIFYNSIEPKIDRPYRKEDNTNEATNKIQDWLWKKNRRLQIEANYIANKLNGVYKKYSIDGYLNLECNYKDGILDGSYSAYFPNGQKKLERYYTNGKKHGQNLRWYMKKGRYTKILEATYINGILDGECKKWHSNGQLKFQGNYILGKQVDIHRHWHSNGTLELEIDYRAITILKRWDANGKLVGYLDYNNQYI